MLKMLKAKSNVNRQRSEQGAMLIILVIVMAFVFAVMTVVATTTYSGANADRALKSHYQAEAAQMLGALTLRTNLMNSVCTATGNAPVNPSSAKEWERFMGYKWEIYRSSKAAGDRTTAPKIGDTDVTAGCPISSSNWVIFKIEGMDNFGIKAVTQLTFEYKANPSAAVPAYPHAFVTGNGSIVEPRTMTSDSPTTIKANFVQHRQASSNFTTSKDFECASTPGTTSNATINGDVITRGQSKLANCTIGGNVYSRLAVFMPETNPGRTIVGGEVCTNQEIVNDNTPAAIAGARKNYTYTCPFSNTSVDLWRDYNKMPLTSSAAPSGWTKSVITAAQCPTTAALTTALITRINALTVPTILDGRACGRFQLGLGASDTSRLDVILRTNVTILSAENGFNVFNTNIRSLNTTQRNLNFVTQDSVGNNNGVRESADCSTTSYNWNMNRFRYANVASATPASGFWYTPCGINFNTTNDPTSGVDTRANPAMRGQVVTGGRTDMPNLRYVPIQLPGAINVAPPAPVGATMGMAPLRTIQG